MSVAQAIILAIIEGLTEFLPISSTGHMIIGSSLMGIADDPFTKTFTVAIQLGAILSVVVLYFKRFFQSFDFYLKLAVAFIPSAVFGLLLNDYIDALLENVVVVAISLLTGGIVFLFIDKWFHPGQGLGKEVSYPSAFKIGLFQVISMIPGVSRSAATIIGGLTQRLSRQSAAEFSFFLAVPTMFAATGLKLFKLYRTQAVGFEPQQLSALLIGNVVAFFVALIAIKSFLNILNKYGFRVFGYYRILLGLTILLLHVIGIKLTLV